MNGASGDMGKSVSAIVVESGRVLLTWRDAAGWAGMPGRVARGHAGALCESADRT